MSKKILSVLLTLSLLFVSGCGESRVSNTKSGFYFNTVVSFCFYGPDTDAVIDSCLELCEYLDGLWDKNKTDSEIYALNHLEGNPRSMEVSEDTSKLISLAIEFSELTDGLVTPLIGGVSSLWDFTSDTPSLPEAGDLAEALKHTDAGLLSVSQNTVTINDPEAQLDLGFIAKGYAADRLYGLAVSEGISSGWINLGGNVMTIGKKPDGSSFNIGIKDPQNESDYITTVSSSDSSVVTSGVYERYFYLDNVRYFHILDVKTGYPVRNNLLSVTVCGPSSAVCDALSTSLFIMGIEEGSEFLKSFS